VIRVRPVAAVLALLLAAPLLRAQSLGDVAKREDEKKKKKAAKPPATAKVYTEEDLKKARESGSAAVTVLPDRGSSSSTSDDDETASGEGRPGGGRRNERYWRTRAAQLRTAVQRADSRITELESRIAALRNDRNPTNLQDPNRLQTRERDLQRAQVDLEAARREAEAARKAIADLEDEARRQGALPGWVREP
jgi:chromosome segregation ATPase